MLDCKENRAADKNCRLITTEYQVERLRLMVYSTQRPIYIRKFSVQFGESVKVIDPYTKVAGQNLLSPLW